MNSELLKILFTIAFCLSILWNMKRSSYTLESMCLLLINLISVVKSTAKFTKLIS